MSSSDEMFPIAKNKENVDLPLTSDEMTALTSVLGFTNSALDTLIKVAEESNDENLDRYKVLRAFSKLMYNKIAVLATIATEDNKTFH